MTGRRRRRRVRAGTIVLLAVCLALGVAAGYLLRRPQQATTTQMQTQAQRENTQWSYADIAEKVSPAVVVVNTQSQEASFRGYRTQTVEGNGSGVYIDKRGYVLTNYHVVQGTSSISVAAEGGASVTVSNYVYDTEYDLALLDVGDLLKDVEPVSFGDSDALRVGDIVLVLGYPGTGEVVLGRTLTVGVVSALNRTGVSAGNVSEDVGMIQTDAAINSGNSGGALINLNGELVGVPTMKMQSTYGTTLENLGFAVPVSDAMDAIERMIGELGA